MLLRSLRAQRVDAAARRTVWRERHKATAVVVGNTWSLDITAVRPRDYIEESGMGGGREQLVHHYVLLAAAVCAFAASDRRSQPDEPRQPSQ